MIYYLIFGDYVYFFWFLCGWLLFEKFGILCREILFSFFDDVGVVV